MEPPRSFLMISRRSFAYSSTIRRASAVREGLASFASSPGFGFSSRGVMTRTVLDDPTGAFDLDRVKVLCHEPPVLARRPRYRSRGGGAPSGCRVQLPLRLHSPASTQSPTRTVHRGLIMVDAPQTES